MAAGKYGLALFSSLTIAHKTKIADIQLKRKKEIANIKQKNTQLN